MKLKRKFKERWREIFGEAAGAGAQHKNVAELKSLGGMDGHELHGIVTLTEIYRYSSTRLEKEIEVLQKIADCLSLRERLFLPCLDEFFHAEDRGIGGRKFEASHSSFEGGECMHGGVLR